MGKNTLEPAAGAGDADSADDNPEEIEHAVRPVALQDGTPGEDDGVNRIEDPDEHRGALRSEPADEGEAENAHQHPGHLDGLDLGQNEGVQTVQEHNENIQRLSHHSLTPSRKDRNTSRYLAREWVIRPPKSSVSAGK